MGMKEAQKLLAQERYQEAASELDRLLRTSKDDGELWYLRAVASLKLQDYAKTQEYLERALFCGKKAKYHQMQGMAHFEIFEIEEAVASFQEAIAMEPDDVTTNFFLALCYMLLDEPRAAGYLQKALEIDKKRTKQLLLNFYSLFIEKDPEVADGARKALLKRIREIK